MGNIVESLAFLPPDRPEAHEQMKCDMPENFKIRQNSFKNDVALLWYDLGSQYTILYSHGNAEDLAGSKATFEDLALNLDVNFCAYDYSGYGLSSGDCSEKACYADIECAYKFLVEEKKIDENKIIVFGRSLGSGPTIHLASLHNNLAGMILQSPLRTAIKTQMPDWVGYVFKKIDIFTNEQKALKITNYPIFIVHGTVDNVVPYSHGKHLYNILKSKNKIKDQVQMYSVDGCGHNDIEYRKGREFKKRLKKFIDNNIKKRKKKIKIKKNINNYNNNNNSNNNSNISTDDVKTPPDNDNNNNNINMNHMNNYNNNVSYPVVNNNNIMNINNNNYNNNNNNNNFNDNISYPNLK